MISRAAAGRPVPRHPGVPDHHRLDLPVPRRARRRLGAAGGQRARAGHRDPAADEPGVHLGVPRRGEPRDEQRAAVARLPDRPAGHAVPALLGPRRRHARHRAVHRWPADRPLATAGAPHGFTTSAAPARTPDRAAAARDAAAPLPEHRHLRDAGTHAEPGTRWSRLGRPDLRRAAAAGHHPRRLPPHAAAAGRRRVVVRARAAAHRAALRLRHRRRRRPACTSPSADTRRRRRHRRPDRDQLLQRPIRVAMHRDRLLLAGGAD